MRTAASAAVPTENETSAAGMLPVDLPSPALIGAWAAINPPAAAVSKTATPLSTGSVASARDLQLGHVFEGGGGIEPSRSHISNAVGLPRRRRYHQSCHHRQQSSSP